MFKSSLKTLAMLGCLSFGLAAGTTAQAQTMSASQVENILGGMMEKPISLFLGVPIAFEKLQAEDRDGAGKSYDVTLVGANLMGQGLGDLSLQAQVAGETRLDLQLDLRELFQGLAAMNQTTASVGTLRVDARLDAARGGYERFRIVVDDLYAANDSNQSEDFLRVDGAIFAYDESEERERVTLDFGVDGISFNERGTEQFYLETVGASFELINLPDWLLHVEANAAFQRFIMAQMGMMPPTFAVADILESLAPLFEEDLIDLESSIEIGTIIMNDVYAEGLVADVAFEGMLLETYYDAEAEGDWTQGTIGSLTLDAVSSWDDTAEPFRLLSFEGATLDASSVYTEGYSLRPVGALLRSVAADVRSLDPEDLANPEALFTDLYFDNIGELVRWALSAVQSSDFEFTTGAIALVNQDEWEPLALEIGSLSFQSDLLVTGDSDQQGFYAGLSGLALKGPEDISVSVGEFGLSYTIYDSLKAIGDLMGGLEAGTLSMGDALRFGLAVYLPDLGMILRDLNLEVNSPLDGGKVSMDLAAFDFGFEASGLDSDAATLSLMFGQEGLALKVDDAGLDPRLLELVLGGQSPGVLPSTLGLHIDLADIPLEMLMTIADTVMLPPIEVMTEPGFDPTSLAFGAVALLSPLLSSPPSIVVQPSEISGGLVEVKAEGSVQISPLTEPNRAIGSITLRVTGVNELSARAGQLMAELAGDESAAAVDSMELLQGLMGFAMMAGGFGAPTDDGALEFVIDIPMGAPANINGLPIPLPF